MVSSLGHCIDESSIFAVDKQEEIRERLEMRSFCLSCCACVPPAGVHVRTTMVCSRFKVVQRRDALLGLPCISSVRQGLGLLAPGDRSAQQQKPSVSPMDHRYMPLRVCFLLRCLFLLCRAIPFACCLLRERGGGKRESVCVWQTIYLSICLSIYLYGRLYGWREQCRRRNKRGMKCRSRSLSSSSRSPWKPR